MPRKTRREKERTAKKRSQTIFTPEVVKREFEFEFRGNYPALNAIKKLDNSHYSTPSNTIYKDLTKTFVIACVLFSLELMIYSLVFKG